MRGGGSEGNDRGGKEWKGVIEREGEKRVT